MLFTILSAFAADPSFVGTEKPLDEAEKIESLLSAELGGAYTTGNTETWAINGGITGSHRWRRNKLSLVGGINVGQSIVDGDADGHLSEAERDGGYVETSRKYFGDGRYDRFFSKKDSLYFLAGALADPFAGYDSRVHGQLGYSRILVDNKRFHAVAEIGADVAREDYVDGTEPNTAMIYAAREMVGVTWNLSETAALSDTIEAYENVLNFSDSRVLNSASLTAKITGKLSLKLSHQLAFDNVPVEGFETLDQTVMGTLVASIL